MKLKMPVLSFIAAAALVLAASNLPAQEGRKLLAGPTPPYPEMARRLHLYGTVKVQVTIAPDGHIKDTKILGGHPIFATSVEDTLKNWKYAPAPAESTAALEFNFKP
jgi:TonB family protein